MFPGTTTKISESAGALSTVTTIKTDLFHVTDTTDTTTLATIKDQFGGGFSGVMMLVNRSGANITNVTTGNIAKAVIIPTNQNCLMVYSKLTGKWYPGAIS